MATITDTRDTSTAEAVKVAQDAARRYMDESASIGRTFYTAWSGAVQGGMRTTFDLQNAMIQASWTVLDATCVATRGWFDQTAEAIHKSQDATIKMMASGFGLAESTMPRPRP